MTAARETNARWLRLRARVREMRAAVLAAECAQRRDARRCDDPAMTAMLDQLVRQRERLDELGRVIDARLTAPADPLTGKADAK